MKKDNLFTKIINALPEEKEVKYEKIYYNFLGDIIICSEVTKCNK